MKLIFAVLTFYLLAHLLGCQAWRGHPPSKESKIDTELSAEVPSEPPPVVPEKPQRGFEQEPPEAQST